MKADGIKLVFTQEAVDKIAEIAFDVNQGTDNIGARRLSTILEKLLEGTFFTKGLIWKWVKSQLLKPMLKIS